MRFVHIINTTQATPFKLIYGRTAILPVKIEKHWKTNEKEQLITYKNGPFHIEEILGNGAYKLRLDNKILTKAAHRDRLKPYHNITLPSTSNVPQLGVQKILARAIYRIHTAFQDQPEILLNKAIDMVTNNQLEKITNTQFEKLQTQITQVILENEIQEILQEGELTELDFNGAQY
ncbi:hypothetical protein G9A89_017694 [Geosiphon pyriformis]|nr:hypothetical protein G9A89_017694 [Geosiphon pyriformis]